MEDISRELEKEIEQSRPKPYKQDRKTKILIVDDFGGMRSGDYLKKVVLGLGVFGLACFLFAVLFFGLYVNLSKKTKHIRTNFISAQEKLKQAVREKEVLMARLVILGEVQGMDKNEQKDGTDSSIASQIKKPIEKKPLEKKEKKPLPPKPVKPEPAKPKIKPQINESSMVETSGNKPDPQQPVSDSRKNVSIEKFTVTRDGNNEDLLVRFDIRNNSKAPGDVSGRIFTVLKPDTVDTAKWLVVPTSVLKNEKPSEYRKGQYFSIAHFKPVKFRIKSHASSESFKKASIYIFDNKGELIFEKLIDITEAQ